MDEPQPSLAAHYRIRIKGRISERWVAWFDGLSITATEPDETLISGPITDQAALHGLIAKVRDLNLTLVSVQRFTPEGQTLDGAAADTTQPGAPMVKPSLRSVEITRSYYGRLARVYDRLTRYETVHHREALKLANIQPGEHVLEVAGGTGRATVELAARVGAKGKLAAVDLSDAMQQHARRKVAARGLLDRVEFRIGDARHLPYPDQHFDALYNAYMFDLIAVDQFGPILADFMRVLRPGGRLVLVNMSKNGIGKTLYECAYERGWAGACRPVVLSPFVHAAGFEDVTRRYRKSAVGLIPLPFGTEIVTARRSID